MIPWKQLDRAGTPDQKSELTLYQRGAEYAIRVDGQELMNSRMYGSEKRLAELCCAGIARRSKARVLIGGLGMGYTLFAALASLRPDAGVVVAELVPAVVQWNREVLGHLAGHPLEDPRVTVRVADVAKVIHSSPSAFDAIILDVDNGPNGLTQEDNAGLYTKAGLSAIRRALRPGGTAAVWSAAPDPGFTRKLKQSAFHVVEKKVRGRAPGKGPVHTIWLAEKPQK